MAVRTGIGLGDGKDHLGAHRHGSQPPVFLGDGPERGDQLAANRRRYEDQEQRTPLRSEFFTDDGKFHHPAAAAVVLLGEVDAEEPEFADRVPELGGAFTRAHLLGVILVTELRGDVSDSGTQHRVFGTLGEVHRYPRLGTVAGARAGLDPTRS